MQSKLDEAIRHYRTALQMNPNHVMAHYNWGHALEAQGKLDEAIEHYAAAVRIDPTQVDTLRDLQRTLARREAAQRQ